MKINIWLPTVDLALFGVVVVTMIVLGKEDQGSITSRFVNKYTRGQTIGWISTLNTLFQSNNIKIQKPILSQKFSIQSSCCCTNLAINPTN